MRHCGLFGGFLIDHFSFERMCESGNGIFYSEDIFLCAYQDIHKRDNSLMNNFYT